MTMYQKDVINVRYLQVMSDQMDEDERRIEIVVKYYYDGVIYEHPLLIRLGDKIGGWDGEVVHYDKDTEPEFPDDFDYQPFIESFPENDILKLLGLDYEVCDSSADDRGFITYIQKKTTAK